MKYILDNSVLFSLDLIPSADERWGLVYSVEKLKDLQTSDDEHFNINYEQYSGNIEEMSKKFDEINTYIQKHTKAVEVPENFDKNNPFGPTLTFNTGNPPIPMLTLTSSNNTVMSRASTSTVTIQGDLVVDGSITTQNGGIIT